MVRFNNNINVAVQLGWTLFDGGRMQITKKRLEEIEALGQINLKNAVQQTTANVLQGYYGIVYNRLLERSTREVITLNEERLRIAEARLAAGFAAQTDALQARIDLNQQRANLLSLQNATIAAKRNLNLLLARTPETPFEVAETSLIPTHPTGPACCKTCWRKIPPCYPCKKVPT
jgi:outer membrane protein